MKFGVVVFPGSNCDHDCYHVAKDIIKQDAELIWHKHTSVDGVDCVILPGGFSYGDYLRAGAIARFSPVMKAVKRFADEGGLVIGICNGFQILLESGLLPGAMIWNRDLKFVCKNVYLRVENNNTVFTNLYKKEEIISIPIAHFQGNYYADGGLLNRMKDNGQIVLKYCSREGSIDSESNPNGSVANIAGILSKRGNVLGMMPHPERCSEAVFGNTDGLRIFQSVTEHFKKNIREAS